MFGVPLRCQNFAKSSTADVSHSLLKGTDVCGGKAQVAQEGVAGPTSCNLNGVVRKSGCRERGRAANAEGVCLQERLRWENCSQEGSDVGAGEEGAGGKAKKRAWRDRARDGAGIAAQGGERAERGG